MTQPTDDLAYYRRLLVELREANADMEAGRFRVFKQEAGSGEMRDITPETIRTNQVSIVLLQGAMALKGLEDD